MKPEEIIISNTPISLRDYFTKTLYQIPVYQREYVWSEKIIEDFLKELINEKDFDYTFFGIIILQKIKNKGKEIYEVIDGQQRSISFSLILKILAAYAKSNLNYSNKVSLKIKEINNLLQIKDIPVVKPSRNDEDLYLDILNSNTIEELYGTLKNHKEYSKRHMYKNTLKIIDVIKNESLNLNSWFSVVDGLLNKIYLVTIAVESRKNANQLFKSFNQKRVTLLLSDLLRNDFYLAGLKNKLPEPKIVNVLEKLNDLFKEISKTNKIEAEEFLYYFINSKAFQIKLFNKKESVIKPLSNNKLYLAFDWLMNDHYKNNLIHFINDLSSTWTNLQPLIDPESIEKNYFIQKEGKVKKDLIDEFVYLYALRAFNIKKGLHIILSAKMYKSRKKYLEILSSIVKFTVRHTFTPKDMKLLELWLAEAATAFFHTDNIASFNRKLKHFRTEQYEKSINRNFEYHEFSNTRAKAILMLLHLKDRGFKNIFYGDRFSDIEIEHIWPDKPTQKTLIGIGINKSEYDAYKRNIGNLILCHQSINGEVKNKSFIQKKIIYQKRKNKMYSASHFILKNENWTEKDIRQRNDNLKHTFSKIF